MALFILLIVLFNFTQLLGLQYSQSVMKVMISPIAHSAVVFRVGETLNFTCHLNAEFSVPEDVHLEWFVPSKTGNSQNKVDLTVGINSVNMVIRSLQENDAGEYKCIASSNTNPDLIDEKSVFITVKQRKRSACADMMFSCTPGADICIHKRFTCDGKRDCKNGEDEADGLCGTAPCRNKLHCSDGRCIPQSWCCDPAHTNCSNRAWHPCCTYPREFPDDGGYAQETQRYNDVVFFQTTIYTVIGCAMAFMLIVTILVIAICRVHLRRSMMPRCPANRALTCRPSAHFSPLNPLSNLGPLNNLPFCDLDVLLNRNTDGMSVNPLLVTYHINNGVQFVGRPVDPPPYCEVVAMPPREGPPPPYASHEDIAQQRANRDEVHEGEDARENEALLPGGPTDATSTFVVNLTEDGLGGSPMLTVVETQVVTSASNEDAVTPAGEPKKTDIVTQRVTVSGDGSESSPM